MYLRYLLVLLYCLPEASAKGGKGGGGRGGGRTAGKSGKSGFGGKSYSSKSGVGSFTLGRKVTPFSGKPSKEFSSYMKGAALGYVAGHRINYYFSYAGYEVYTNKDDKVCSDKINASHLINSSMPIENLTVTNSFVTVYYLCDGICCDGDCCYQKFWQSLLIELGSLVIGWIIITLFLKVFRWIMEPLLKCIGTQYDNWKRSRQERSRVEDGDFLNDSNNEPFEQTVM